MLTNNKMNKNQSKTISWIVILSSLVITFFFLYQMKENAYMETDLDEYMPKEHPAFVYSDKAEEWFHIKDGILIAIENKNGIYNSGSLQKIKDMTKQLQDMNEFDDNDVTSLYSADNITGSADGMEVESFYSKVPKSEEKLKEIQAKVKTNDMVFGRLISEDETVALVVAGMNDSTFTEEFYNQILEFAHSFEGDGDKIYVAGRPIVEGTMGLLGPADMKRMVPIVLIVIALVLYFLTRSVRATTATLFSVFLSTIWAFGLMAWLKVPIYSVSTMMPVMLIAIGVAYGIYFYNHLNEFLSIGNKPNLSEGVKNTIKILWKPLAMAAFTTLIGFLSLLTSQVYPIKYFGIFTAFGILVAFVLALAFLPASVILFGYSGKKGKTDNSNTVSYKIQKLTDKILEKKNITYITLAFIVIISLYGISKVWINSSFLDKFETDSDIVLTDNFVNSKFGGTSTLNVILESTESNAFKNPENLSLIDRMQTETEKLPKVGNSFALSDYLKRMNKVMNEDKAKFYAIPESSDMVAQYLLLYEMSGDPENLTKVVNYDYNRSNVTFQLKGDDSKTINEAMAVIKSYEDDFKAKGIEIKYAGSGYKALVFTDLILEGQIYSIVMSLVMVFILLSLMFKSIKVGLIGSVPIVITALISFGVMGLLDIPLSTTTALLSSIAIGIGIDYAIHFLENYKLNLLQTSNPVYALYATMGITGRAILYNAIVVISGFLVLLFSVFPPNRTLGALVSMNMFTSLIGTLSIMMILSYTFKIFSIKNHTSANK
jgi:predicted RND superfamily exporter protein